MTHHHQTNGASLEDCHTNFFALTELCGIKWRKLVWGETGGGEAEGAAPLEDPVISSYARCLAGDILCVWRRVSAPSAAPPNADPFDTSVPPPPPPPPLSLRAAKELWIFWYGEEPDLNGLVAPELVSCQSEQGSWESGLSYECRSLLFKALHNLIERCLLSRDFIRLGKWFVQPYDGDEEEVGKSPWHLSFSFAFFVHGESTVCASVDVRQHPPVRTLSPHRLRAPAPRNALRDHRDKVILAPFGLEGTLTGAAWSESDPATGRLLDAWRQLYPLQPSATAVEVVSSGVKLRYPAAYVLLAEPESGAPPLPHHQPPPSAHSPVAPAAAMAERVVRALRTTDIQAMELCNGELPAEKADVDFVEPTRKVPCTCSKRRGGARSGASGGRAARRQQPFHRRARLQPAAHALSAGVCSPGSCGGGSPAAPASAPPSAGPAPTSPSHLTAASNQLGGTLHTPAPTPDPHAPPTPAPPCPRQHYTQASPPESKVNGVYGGSALVFGAGGGGCGEGGAPVTEDLLKRPSLTSEERQQEPLDDEHTLHMLYDYTCVRAWLEHPVKRFKTEDSGFREELTQPKGFGTDTELYRGHDHTEMASVRARVGSPLDPHHANDDTKESKNLFTLDGLFPSVLPPDQIFDNSDDAASGDEALQIQTPPDSNKSGADEVRLTSNGGTRCVRAEELSKMFPTPPSMEAHTQASPGAFTLPDDPSHTSTHLTTRLHAPSPSPDPIEDWSYVFKPPTMYKYVGSSKYAPLTTLPSQLLPPVTLPPHAVYRPRWEDGGAGGGGAGAGSGVKRPASPIQPVHSAGTISAPASVGCPGSAGAISQGIGSSPALRPPPPYAASPPSPPSPPASPRAHACPLLLNVLLADTVLNIFRDHNFDSCTLCVCNASLKVVGNIRGADCNTYLTGGSLASPGESPPPSPAPQPYDDDPIRCSCGFSAIVNRRLAHRAGLFYEDEMEITGLAEDPSGKPNSRGLTGITEIVLSQCAGFGGAASSLARAAHEAASAKLPDENRINLLEYTDGGEAAALALRAAAGISVTASVHRWPFISARGPRSSRDVVRLMRRLRPMLQDAIQKRCCGARMWDGVSGPLTWRQFHRLAGRGTEDLCEPQPVPPLLVGHDRDWLSLSPYALRHWERLSLEPYSYGRDVAYVVLAPEGESLTEPLRIFFKELSTVYESCRLGRHAPLWRIAKDGVVRASVTPDRDAAPPRDEWISDVPPGRLGECIRAYAETLRTVLVPQLANLTLDRTLFEPDSNNKILSIERPSPSPMRPPSTPDHPPTPNSQSDQEGESGSGNSSGGSGATPTVPAAVPGPPTWDDEEEGGAPALVLYVVEPPRAHAHAPHALHALLRLASRVSAQLHHHNLTIKIISLEGVCSGWTHSGGSQATLRQLAFSVLTCSRRLLVHTPHSKSLTGFGSAALARRALGDKDEKNRAPYRLYTPAYILAPAKAIKDVAESFGQPSIADQCSVLYISYCLSQDQSSLLAVATDARGELLESAVINIHVPGRARRRRSGPARRLGLTKLMDFILGVMSQTAQPWRLVVGRVGRIGHGELKGWSWLLSRRKLVAASAVLRDLCSSCAVLYPSGATPCILSACLVSTQPDSCLRLMADRFTPDERFSQASVASQLHTPRDVTATHILVFPTSATTQSSQTAFQEQHINGNENDDILFPVLPENEDMPEGMDGIDNMNDIFNNEIFNNMWSTNSPTGVAGPEGTGSRDGSPGRGAQGRQAHSDYGQSDDPAAASEQIGTVLQQPLALGYLVSTAPLGAMPAWWWAGCSHLRDACPAFLKNALHLHSPAVQQSSDDMLLPAAQRAHDASHHPLDSHITTDVLRYVLEGYNALSWLALDGNTHDRLSCLPIHVQVLMQLYHTALALS